MKKKKSTLKVGDLLMVQKVNYLISDAKYIQEEDQEYIIGWIHNITIGEEHFYEYSVMWSDVDGVIYYDEIDVLRYRKIYLEQRAKLDQ